jgi:hypothetical protein
MTKKNSAAAFLENMQQSSQDTENIVQHESQKNSKKLQSGTRAGLKHIGGYLDIEAVEKVAILRARLSLDNSELITLAINELYSKQVAKKAFDG